VARGKSPDLSVPELESLLAQQKSRVTILDKKRSELQAELESVEQQLESLQGSAASTTRTGNRTGRRGKRPKNAQSLAAVVTGILEKSSKGLSLDDLTAQVINSGYQTKAKSFSNVVYQCVYNSKAIHRDKKSGTYRLKTGKS
jgi:hypothetical protein